MSSLLSVAGHSGGDLKVLDFGGSLGSTYFQYRRVLEDAAHVEWSVVELPDFVAAGRREAEEGSLRFFESIEDFNKVRKANVILFSSVLQYLEDPFTFLQECVRHNFAHIIIDRTPCWMTPQKDRIMIQRVDPSIYDAQFAMRVFNYEKLLSVFEGGYEPWMEYVNEYNVDLPRMKYRGFLLRSRNNS